MTFSSECKPQTLQVNKENYFVIIKMLIHMKINGWVYSNSFKIKWTFHARSIYHSNDFALGSALVNINFKENFLPAVIRIFFTLTSYIIHFPVKAIYLSW